ncbi:MAG: DnaJ C-terminal domain-containing protein [Microscillaceae bacterium]
MKYQDYYQVLGISRQATADEIKKAYRKLAVQYHPDKHKGDKAMEKKFQEISEAYNVLSDPEKRRKYDRLGANWQQYEQTGFDFNFDLNDIFGSKGVAGGFSDFFKQFFGGGSSETRPQSIKGKDAEFNLSLSLEEAYHGTSRTLHVGDEKIKVPVKPGVAHDQVLRVRGKGGFGQEGGPRGDLLIKVQIDPHPQFERRGEDLHQEIWIDLYTAILGGKIAVKTLKEKPIQLQIPAGTENGKTLRLKDLGMPIFKQADSYGSMYLKIMVKLPQALTPEEKALFERLASMRKMAEA